MCKNYFLYVIANSIFYNTSVWTVMECCKCLVNKYFVYLRNNKYVFFPTFPFLFSQFRNNLYTTKVAKHHMLHDWIPQPMNDCDTKRVAHPGPSLRTLASLHTTGTQNYLRAVLFFCKVEIYPLSDCS